MSAWRRDPESDLESSALQAAALPLSYPAICALPEVPKLRQSCRTVRRKEVFTPEPCFSGDWFFQSGSAGFPHPALTMGHSFPFTAFR